MPRIVVLDIEIERSVEQCGGWGAARNGEAGMSIAVTYSTESDPDERQWRFWDEKSVDALCDYLEAADAVVGWNTDGFDIPVIEAISGRALDLTSVDLYKRCADAAGYRKGWGLDNVGESTLGIRKSGHGADAPLWWQEGRIAEVVDYCSQDVYVTLRLMQHALEGKPLSNGDDQTCISVPELRGE